MNPIRILAVALLAALALAGCGSSSKANVTVTGTTTVSRGQELIDLQRALDAGAISKADYDRVREKLLRRPQ
jgi:ABC-type glycerol-3-phosphate transport system substrate-binding protein